LPIVLIAVAFAGLFGMHKSRWLVASAVVLFFASPAASFSQSVYV
jgi:hypothetical protein